MSACRCDFMFVVGGGNAMLQEECGVVGWHLRVTKEEVVVPLECIVFARDGVCFVLVNNTLHVSLLSRWGGLCSCAILLLVVDRGAS